MRHSNLQLVSVSLMFSVKPVALWLSFSLLLYFDFVLASTAGEGFVYCTFRVVLTAAKVVGQSVKSITSP